MGRNYRVVSVDPALAPLLEWVEDNDVRMASPEVDAWLAGWRSHAAYVATTGAGAERVHVFSNGEAYRIWLHNNCFQCVKEPDCLLRDALSSACVLDGTINADVAQRLGVPGDGSERWWCRERQTEATTPSPGGLELPGFDTVAVKPEDGRKPWTG